MFAVRLDRIPPAPLATGSQDDDEPAEEAEYDGAGHDEGQAY
jgi:hypothetical protein